jgi:AAA15 family ATPase/GTPase
MEKVTLTKIKIQNFKSLKDVEVNLTDLNILIGENASGKSNFISVFSFLKYLFNLGIEGVFNIPTHPTYFMCLYSLNEPEKNFISFNLEFSNDLIYEINLSIEKINIKDYKLKIDNEFLYYKNSENKIIERDKDIVRFETGKTISFPSQFLITSAITSASKPWSTIPSDINEKIAEVERIKEIEIVEKLLISVFNFNPNVNFIKNKPTETDRFNYKLLSKCSNLGEFLYKMQRSSEAQEKIQLLSALIIL